MTGLRGFGPAGILALLLVLAGGLLGPVVGAALVLVWARLSRTPLSALGLVRPSSWTTTLVGGAAFGIALKLAMKALVMPLLGAPAMNMSFHFLAGNAAALPGMIATILVSAGFGEEVFYRGYLFERIESLLGPGRATLVCAVAISSVLFSLAHYRGQGLPGVEQAAVTGLVLAGVFAWRKQLWTLIVTHVAFDLTAVALIYGSWEERVAHLLFR